MSSNDDSVSVEEAFGGWPGMDLGEDSGDAAPPADVGDGTQTPADDAEGGVPAPIAEPQQVTEASTETEVPEWKQYGFKDEAAMFKSYKELQAEYTRVKQGFTPPPDETEPEEVPPTWQDHQFQALGEIPRVGLSAPQRTQLADLMQVDPRAAALWAYQNQQFMEPSDFKAVQNNFAAADPEEYWSLKQAITQEQQREQREASESSQRDWVITQQREHAISQAKQALPLMEEKSEEFGEWLTAPENAEISNMLDSINDPARLHKALIAAFYQFAGPTIYSELTSSHQAAASAQAERERLASEAAAAAAEKSKGARTQTRTSAAATGGEADADEALRNLILNPYGTA